MKLKKLIFMLLSLFLFGFSFAQIGIGTEHPTAQVEIVGDNLNSPVKLENVLMGRGNYTSVNEDGEVVKTGIRHLSSFILPTIVSSTPLTANSYSGFGQYNTSDIFDPAKWLLIPGLGVNVNIEFNNNIIDIHTEGTVQIGSIDFDTGEYISYGIGIFVNDRLIAARVFNLRGTANNNESMKWEVHGQVTDLLSGNNDIKVAIDKRGSFGTFTGNFIVAGPSTAPTTPATLSSFQSKAYLQIKGTY